MRELELTLLKIVWALSLFVSGFLLETVTPFRSHHDFKIYTLPHFTGDPQIIPNALPEIDPVANTTDMNLDAELMFECLIYLNCYYFPVFGLCQSIMWTAKHFSTRETKKSSRDGCILCATIICELAKILLYQRFKDVKRELTTSAAVLLTVATVCLSSVTLFIQCPIIKLELILYTIMLMLATTELMFGYLQLFRIGKRSIYQ